MLIFSSLTQMTTEVKGREGLEAQEQLQDKNTKGETEKGECFTPKNISGSERRNRSKINAFHSNSIVMFFLKGRIQVTTVHS